MIEGTIHSCRHSDVTPRLSRLLVPSRRWTTNDWYCFPFYCSYAMDAQMRPKNYSGEEVVCCVSGDWLWYRGFSVQYLLAIGRLPSLLEDVVRSILYLKQKLSLHMNPLWQYTRSRNRSKRVGDGGLGELHQNKDTFDIDRNRDHVIILFLCDICIFRKLKKMNPIEE